MIQDLKIPMDMREVATRLMAVADAARAAGEETVSVLCPVNGAYAIAMVINDFVRGGEPRCPLCSAMTKISRADRDTDALVTKIEQRMIYGDPDGEATPDR